MAHMVTKETVTAAREKYDDLAVVCYINSTAEIKSWSDVAVTSANAVKIVKNLPNKHILFIPDKNLARHVAKEVPEKDIFWSDGYCPIHEKMSADEILKLKKEHPNAKVLVHPECNEAVLKHADYIGSTSGICKRKWAERIYHWNRSRCFLCLKAGETGCGILFSKNSACMQ